MNLANIKARMKEISPFLKLQFFGHKNALAETVDGQLVPLTVCLTPPSVSFILESGHMTSLILRYSETYKSQAEKIGDSPDKEGLMKQVLGEVTDEITGSPEEQAKQLAVISKLGREYLIAKAVSGYYGDEKDSFKVVFSNSKEMVDELNAQSKDDELAILVDALDDMEMLNVGMNLMSAMPLDDIPEIPIRDSEIQPDGSIKEEVVSTVPANRVAAFPRSTRGLAVEDVPARSGAEVGDSFD
jgi:hypothetical protein